MQQKDVKNIRQNQRNILKMWIFVQQVHYQEKNVNIQMMVKRFFKIVDKRSNKIFTNDIIVIDEISMMNENQLDFN